MTQYVFRGDPKNELELTRKKEGEKYSLGRERSKEQNEYQKWRENRKKRKDGAGRGLALQQSSASAETGHAPAGSVRLRQPRGQVKGRGIGFHNVSFN